MIIDERFTRNPFKLGAFPAPERLDFLRGPALPSVFGDTETPGYRILNQYAPTASVCYIFEARQAFCRFTRPRTAKGRRALIEDEGSFALCQKNGSKVAAVAATSKRVGRVGRRQMSAASVTKWAAALSEPAVSKIASVNPTPLIPQELRTGAEDVHFRAVRS